MGTPYRVLADEGMLESGVVRLQDRDTTIQVHVHVYIRTLYLALPSILPDINCPTNAYIVSLTVNLHMRT